MPTEILMLVLTALLSLVVAFLTIAVHFRTYGGKMIRGNRGDFPPLTGLAMRVVRAHANLNEALLPFAILVVVAAVLHVSTPWTIDAAIAFFAARMAHALLYLIGATPWRSISYYSGLIATLVFATQLPFGG
jgi:uncharacterized MAPEG superfamily protein